MTKIQVRKGLFETNSSSVHSLVMCSDSDFEKWKSGEYVFNRWDEMLVPTTNKDYVEWNDMSDEDKEDNPDFLTYEQFFDYDYQEYETYVQTHVTPSGEKVIAFGYYGHD